MKSHRFWEALTVLVSTSTIVIDRPRGSAHPRMPAVIYPLDYGYLRGTVSGDGQGIDVWLGTLVTKRVTGVVCTVDRRKRDIEIKILIGCSRSEKNRILSFHNHRRGDQGAILLDAPPHGRGSISFREPS
jgi:inorganic pyrophosphatase